jgi:outer membrane protein OmpA-like peptidoglycan-associated protein
LGPEHSKLALTVLLKEIAMNSVFLKPLFAMLFGLGLGLCGTVAAQSPDKTPAAAVLKGAQVSESNLIDALEIDAPESAASGALTRGFRAATRTDGSKAAKPANPNAGKASLQVTFTTNSADLTEEAKGVLDTLARALQSDRLAGFAFKIEGHADARGDADRNLQLSQLRAEAVAAYLIAQHGLLPERLSPVGRGSSELLNTQRTDAPENRRVTIVTVRN